MSDALHDAASTLLAALPAHAAELNITHNAHTCSYMTVAEWLRCFKPEPLWQSPEARQRAVDTGDVWEMQWCPDTPVASVHVAAPTLAELLAFAGAL